MPFHDPIPGEVRTVSLFTDQCITVHLSAGAVVHVSQGSVAVIDAPRWLAGQVCQPSRDLHAGGVRVIERAGWHQLVARGPAQLRIMLPAARPGVWRLIKSRFGRSGLLLGNPRPPDIKAAE